MAILKNTTINDTGSLEIPSGSSAQRPASPSTGMIRFNTDYNSSEYYDGSQWIVINILIGLNSNTPATSASQLRDLGYPSGVYWIDWGGTPRQIYCEMNLEGGGWMMVLNYVHQGGTNPALTVRTTDFPLLNVKYTLGSDESSSNGVGGTWGHISNSLADDYNWSEYMFYGKTSGHNRIIHFTGSVSGVVSYIKTGTGSMTGIQSSFSTGSLAENSPNLPAVAENFFSDEGDFAMTNFPYYEGGAHHWGIRGAGNRWEVDDYPDNSSNDTIHRIWVR